jgi:hypothetical protein
MPSPHTGNGGADGAGVELPVLLPDALKLLDNEPLAVRVALCDCGDADSVRVELGDGVLVGVSETVLVVLGDDVAV